MFEACLTISQHYTWMGERVAYEPAQIQRKHR